MSARRSVIRGAALGLGIGALIAGVVIWFWWSHGHGLGEALEGPELLTAYLAAPTSLALIWLIGVGDPPTGSLLFFLAAPIVQYGALGAIVGRIVYRPPGRFDHRRLDHATDT